MSEWILMAERYPPYDKPVLVTDGDYCQIRTLRFKEGIKLWTTDHKNKMTYSVSHWMPLPEPPK